MSPVYVTPVDVSTVGQLGGSQSSLALSQGVPQDVGNPLDSGEDLTSVNRVFDELTGQMSDVSKSMMSGKIPEDVVKQIKQMAAENTLSRGLGAGSPAGRNLTMRDLGRTSLDLVSAGAQIADTTAKLAETRRQFNIQQTQQWKEYRNSVAQTGLSAAELSERSRQFNVSSALSASELLGKTLASYHDMARLYSQQEGSEANMGKLTTDFAGLMTKLRSTLGW